MKYIEENIWLCLIVIIFTLFQSIFLFLLDVNPSLILLSGTMYLLLLGIYLAVGYHMEAKKKKEIEDLVDNLDEKYVIAELIKKPKNIKNQGYYYALKKACKSMNDKISELEQKYQDYEEFIESFVHEIKTPLAALSLYSDNQNDQELKQEIKKMDNLVEEILFYARSEKPEKDYFVKQIKLSEIIHQVMMQNKDFFLKNKIKIKIQNLDIFVATDEKWIIFIINQIINNAIKYLDKQEKTIEMKGYEEKNKVILEIKDNGCGINESDLPRVFDKGFTGSNRTKEHSTGFGLYLCKKLCRKLNLNIEIESKEKEYTIVKLVFPNSSLHTRK